MNLNSLRHVAKEILAIATLELFPGVQLVGGSVDEIGFHYDFLFSKEILTAFSRQELLHLEDRMIQIVHERRPIKKLEMMRENAAALLEHLNQPMRAEAALSHMTNILSLIEIDSFRDVCPTPSIENTGELKAFKLQRFESDKGTVRIYGTAFFKKKELKNFLKKYKEAVKRDPLLIGPAGGYFLLPDSISHKRSYRFEQAVLPGIEEHIQISSSKIDSRADDKIFSDSALDREWIYLEKGARLLQKLKNFWEQRHSDFESLVFSDSLDRNAIHEFVLQKKKYTQIASLSLFKGDFVSIKCEHDQELFDALISSLHFIEKAFKIFAFESRIYCLEPKEGWLFRALKKEGLAFAQELSTAEEAHIAFRVVDGYGREKTLSYIGVERKRKVLHRSLFHSPKRWVAHMIEKGVEFEFSC